MKKSKREIVVKYEKILTRELRELNFDIEYVDENYLVYQHYNPEGSPDYKMNIYVNSMTFKGENLIFFYQVDQLSKAYMYIKEFLMDLHFTLLKEGVLND